MNDALSAAARDLTPWAGATPDETLALGATEYSVAQAKEIVRTFAEVTTTCDTERFISGFTSDCIVSFNEHANLVGHDALRRFMGPRFAHFGRPGTSYVCRKVLRSLTGNIFGVIWISDWREPDSGQQMRSKGVEFWVMDAGRIARWDAGFAAWPITA